MRHRILFCCLLLLIVAASAMSIPQTQPRTKSTRLSSPNIKYERAKVKRGITFHTSLRVAVNYVWDFRQCSSCSWAVGPGFPLANMDIINPEQQAVSSLVLEKGEVWGGGGCQCNLLQRTEQAELTSGTPGTYSLRVKSHCQQGFTFGFPNNIRAYTLVTIWIDGNPTPVVSNYPIATDKLVEIKEMSWPFTKE